MTAIAEIRRRYAEQVVLGAPRALLDALVDAYATVPREVFVGAGPWSTLRPGPGVEFETTADGDVERVYRDVVISLIAAKGLNNGQPSAQAKWILAAAVRPGDRVVHVGCGTGYYTAIFAELVGRSGHVLAYDVEAQLVERARANLAPWPQVDVVHDDAATIPGVHDVVYVNAGATHARAEWLAALRPGGRLILPLTIQKGGHGIGATVAIERPDDAALTRWPVRMISPVGIYDCANARSPEAEAQLAQLIAGAQAGKRPITGLVVDTTRHERTDACLLHVDGFCLMQPQPR